MDGSIKFSIIVPCYNVENYIDECVESIIRQKYSNWELILVNDASTDNTLNKIEVWATKDVRIRALNKEHGGLPHTRNYGMQYVSGDYLILVDGDDYVDDKFLENDAEMLADSSIDMLIHNQHTNFTNTDREVITLFAPPSNDTINEFEVVFAIDNYLPASAVLTTYRIKYLKENSITYSEQYSCSEDLDFFLHAISCKPIIKFADYEFYFYRQDNMNAMTKNITSQMEIDRLSIYKKWYDFWDKENAEPYMAKLVKSKISSEMLVQLEFVFRIFDNSQHGNVISFFKKNKYLFPSEKSFNYIYYIEKPIRKIRIEAGKFRRKIFKNG